MIIADRHHLLALQAWKRIQVLGMDPVESIRRAIIYATRENVHPYTAADLTKVEAETVLAMGVDPIFCSDLATMLNINTDVLYQRLKRLLDRGVVKRVRVGVWVVNQTPPTERRGPGRPRTLPDTPKIEATRARHRAWHERRKQQAKEKAMPDPSDREPPEHFVDVPPLCTNCDREAPGENPLCDRCACPTCGMLNPSGHMCHQPCEAPADKAREEMK